MATASPHLLDLRIHHTPLKAHIARITLQPCSTQKGGSLIKCCCTLQTFVFFFRIFGLRRCNCSCGLTSLLLAASMLRCNRVRTTPSAPSLSHRERGNLIDKKKSLDASSHNHRRAYSTAGSNIATHPRYEPRSFINYSRWAKSLSIVKFVLLAIPCHSFPLFVIYRARLNRPLTLAEKIIYSHAAEPEKQEFIRGKVINAYV